MAHIAEPGDELLLCFDENGKEIEPHTRAEVHTKPLKYWHGITGVYVANKNGEILCSKRSDKLSQKPGCWQSHFGGHVNFGETFEANAARELFEESGILKKENDLYFFLETKNAEGMHIGKYYTCLFEGSLGDLSFPDGEVTEVKWIAMEDAWEEKLKNPENWAGSCPPERQEKIKEWLKNITNA